MSKKVSNLFISQNGNTNPSDCFNALKCGLVSDNLSHLLGEVLTIIDASTEGDKNKAIKDIIKKVFSEKQSWICELAWKKLEEIGEGHSPRQDWEDGLVPLVDLKGNKFSFKN